MIMEELQGSDTPRAGLEMSKRDILRHTKRAWAPLDGHLLPDSEEENPMVTMYVQGKGPSRDLGSALLWAMRDVRLLLGNK
jgi:hypothetical protein